MLLTPKLGAKRLYIYGGLMVIPGMIMLLITTLDYLPVPYGKYINVCGSLLIILGFTGPKMSLSIYPSELTTFVTRPVVLWMSSAGYYIVAIVVSFLTPVMASSIQGFAYLPWIICFISTVSYRFFFVSCRHTGKLQTMVFTTLKATPISVTRKIPWRIYLKYVLYK